MPNILLAFFKYCYQNSAVLQKETLVYKITSLHFCCLKDLIPDVETVSK